MVIPEAPPDLGFKVGPAIGRFALTVTNGQLTTADRIPTLTESFVQGICQSARNEKSQSFMDFTELVRQLFVCVCLVTSKCLFKGWVQSENCFHCNTTPTLS